MRRSRRELVRDSNRILLRSDQADARRQIRKHVPLEPGVYGMVDAEGELIYVGQSHMLRDRLLSYVSTAAQYKARRIIAHTHRLFWQTVPDAFAAQLRELELIRRWRPRFNVRGQPGRNRAAYVVLGRTPAPHVYLGSQPAAGDRIAFGPIRASRLARRAVELINDSFQLRTCSPRIAMRFANEPDMFDQNRSLGAALCVRYDLGSCLGLCEGTFWYDQYAERVAQARSFLQGDDDRPLERLQGEMLAAANERRYEQAGALRDVHRALHYLRNQIVRLRDARQNYRFVYRLAGKSGRATWYFIYRGQVIGAMAEPQSAREVKASHEMLARLENDDFAAATSVRTSVILRSTAGSSLSFGSVAMPAI